MALTPQEIAASQYFDADAYVEAKARIMVINGKSNSHEDAKAQFLSNWPGDMADHYLQYGAAENVNPSNSFDNSNYIQQVADDQGVTYQVLKADWESQGIAPLEHFLEEGEDQGFTAPAVPEGEQVDDPSDFTPVDIDTGTLQAPAVFDAANGAYNFMDDSAVPGSVVINNVSDDDIISFSNADVSDYIFQHEDTDVTLSYNYNDEGIMNVIKLAGVVSSDDLVHDQASLSAALGFDVFGG